MLKRNILRSVALAAVVICMFLLTACGGEPINESIKPTSAPTTVQPSDETPTPVPTVAPADAVAKINGDADENGICSIVVRMTDKAADKGVVELVYYGEKGSPQEKSIVNTFRIEYYKETSGTFEISTFYNGEKYQNIYHKAEVKVTNTFDATLRAGSVIISYTPEGGEKKEIFRADAKYFNPSSK